MIRLRNYGMGKLTPQEIIVANNWRKHPESIFWQAGPLFIIAISLMTAQAVLEIKIYHDFVDMWIEAAGIALLLFAISPIALTEYRRRKYVQQKDAN